MELAALVAVRSSTLSGVGAQARIGRAIRHPSVLKNSLCSDWQHYTLEITCYLPEKSGRMVKKLCLWDKKPTFVVENKLQWKRTLI